MGQKVHPIGIRLGISKKWSSNWFSDSSSFSKNVHQDFMIRELLNKKLKDAAVSNIQICLLYTSPSPRDGLLSRMPSSA